MSKIKIKKGLVVAHGDNTVTIVKNDPIKKTVSIEILNAFTGETLPANLTHAEFTEKYLSDDVFVSSTSKDEPIEALPKLKMADGSIHSFEDAEIDSIQLVHLESGKTQILAKEYFKHLVDNNHVKIV
jgi:hypothetical protein